MNIKKKINDKLCTYFAFTNFLHCSGSTPRKKTLEPNYVLINSNLNKSISKKLFIYRERL